VNSDQLVCLKQDMLVSEMRLKQDHLLDIDDFFSIFKSNVCELFSDNWQWLGVPELGQSSIVPLSNEKNYEADDKESHEAALHHVLLSKHCRVKRLVWLHNLLNFIRFTIWGWVLATLNLCIWLFLEFGSCHFVIESLVSDGGLNEEQHRWDHH